MNSLKVAFALRALADAFEEGGQDAQPPAGQTTETAKPRGRGRPPKGGDDTPASAPVASTAATDDPFAAPAAAAAPTATLDEVRKALTDLKNASTQEKAVAVLKDAGGAGNLTELKPEKYGDVVAAAKKALTPAAVEQPVEDDPFALPGTAAPAQEKAISVEEVKAAVVEAQKHSSTDAVQKVVMEHGGKAKNPDTGVEGPSLKALPVSKYEATIKALKALPKTK